MPFKTKEEKSEYDKKRYIERREQKLAYMKKYRKDNPHVRKDWEKRNTVRINQKKRQWEKENRDKYLLSKKMNTYRRRAKRLGLLWEYFDTEFLFSTMLCGICGEKVIGDYVIDHKIPFSKGGTHTKDNVQLAHPLCNLRKGVNIIV